MQQSPTNIEMMRLLGGSATPMGFGDVYTALQSDIIDGAENNEMALTDNGHGDVCKFYSYDMHQMVPDILIGNNGLHGRAMSDEERAIFEEGYEAGEPGRAGGMGEGCGGGEGEGAERAGMWSSSIRIQSRSRRPACRSISTCCKIIPSLQPIYDAIQAYNAEYPAGGARRRRTDMRTAEKSY